jgi:hypothetical protein
MSMPKYSEVREAILHGAAVPAPPGVSSGNAGRRLVRPRELLLNLADLLVARDPLAGHGLPGIALAEFHRVCARVPLGFCALRERMRVVGLAFRRQAGAGAREQNREKQTRVPDSHDENPPLPRDRELIGNPVACKASRSFANGNRPAGARRRLLRYDRRAAQTDRLIIVARRQATTSMIRCRRSAVYSSLAFGLLLAPAAKAEAPPDVRALMTAEEFKAAGLERLSPEELEALNRWLLRYSATQATELRQHNELVKEEIQKVEQEGIRTRIAGEFFGWDGHTLFRLENGQVWKQRLPGQWRYRASNPEVELSKNFMGFWTLRVLEADRAVGVTRVD